MSYEHTPEWVAAVEDGNRIAEAMRKSPEPEQRKRGDLWQGIRQLLRSERGCSSARLAALTGVSNAEACDEIRRFRLNMPHGETMHGVKLLKDRAVHWFRSPHAAAAFLAADPLVRVVAKPDTVRVVVNKAVVEVPRHAARRVAREILEALEC